MYLPDEQIVDNAGTISGTRYYAIGGVTIAARTSSGQVEYLYGNQQGTATLAIDSGTLAVARRYYDPYGNPIGTPPGSWPGNRGFVSGTTDTTTGLTNLGAREYNPATGSFIATDPVLTPTNPQDLNPYAYAYDTPATQSDPTGQCPQEPACAGVPQPGPPGHRHIQPPPAPPCGTPGGQACWTPQPPSGSDTGSQQPIPSAPQPQLTRVHLFEIISKLSASEAIECSSGLPTGPGCPTPQQIATQEKQFNECAAQPSCPSYLSDNSIEEQSAGSVDPCPPPGDGEDVGCNPSLNFGGEGSLNGASSSDSIWSDVLAAAIEFLVDLISDSCDVATDGACLGLSPGFWQAADFGTQLGNDIGDLNGG